MRALGAVEAADPEEALAHGPFDVALELVGGAGVATLVQSMNTSGRIVVIGVGAGSRVEIDLLAMMHKRLTLRASTLRARPIVEKAAVARAVEAHVVPLLASGPVRVPVAATFPMSEATDAYERFAIGGKFGKIVLQT